jgi:peptide chain release factor 2
MVLRKTLSELVATVAQMRERLRQLWKFAKIEELQEKLRAHEVNMSAACFWDRPEESRKTLAEVSRLNDVIKPLLGAKQSLDDLEMYVAFLQENGCDEAGEDFAAVGELCDAFAIRLDAVELQSFLCGPHDRCNAIVSIHSGAGGTEACDWAEMVLRMYLRWAELRKFSAEIEDLQPGEEAGISRVTFRLVGENAYGYAKAERGVHRLVRISPFDANRRRHTSFCAVDVIAEIDDDVAVDIREEDLRVDVYRSSGKGGQHVNKTESAVRLTHLPTGIVVACQNERSQIKNRATAMRILRARIYERMQDEKRSAMERFYGEKGEIGWGNQIRSYVFQPYQLVKDLRTGVETGNVQAVMDGALDEFVNGWLRAGCPTARLCSSQT